MQLMRCAMVFALSVVSAAAFAGGSTRATTAPALVIPQVATPIQCDGELDELAWQTPARTGAFVDGSGGQAAPYSDARFLRDGQNLYLALYAADEDIKSSDEFVIELRSARGRAVMHITSAGLISPAIAGAHASVDLDGSRDDASNDDEEWVVEAAIPLVAIPFGQDGHVSARISRCDTPKDGKKRCGSWSGTLVRR